MKTRIIIAIALLCIVVAHPTLGQESTGGYQGNFNFVVYGYGHGLQQNLHNNGLGVGTYADYSTKLSRAWRIGGYANISMGGSRDNVGHYTSRSGNYGLGAVISNYQPGFSMNYQLFWSTGVGIKYNTDHGESSWSYGNYVGEQKTYLLAFSASINLQKKVETKFCPRTELWISWQIPIKSQKQATWNGEAIKISPWNKEYIQLQIRNSLWSFLFEGVYVSPELIGVYTYDSGAAESNFGIGSGLSVHEKGKDNILSGYYIIKFNSAFDRNNIILGVNINLARIF